MDEQRSNERANGRAGEKSKENLPIKSVSSETSIFHTHRILWIIKSIKPAAVSQVSAE